MQPRVDRVPPSPPFLGSRAAPPGSVLLLGLPSEAGASFRKGPAAAPQAVRAFSDSVESFSLLQGRDLEEVGLWDAGDLLLPAGPPEAVIAAVEAGVRQALEEGGSALAFLLGGDHSVSLGAARAVGSLHADLAVLVLDAHLDLRVEYRGERYSHATVVRRLAEAFPTYLVGFRSASREEFLALEGRGWGVPEGFLGASMELEIPEGVERFLQSRPLYLSIDIDVLDPAEVPGVGNPEPGGPSFREVLAFLRSLSRFRVVGVDLVETAPTLDPTGRTGVVAAVLVREAVLAFSAGWERA